MVHSTSQEYGAFLKPVVDPLLKHFRRFGKQSIRKFQLVVGLISRWTQKWRKNVSASGYRRIERRLRYIFEQEDIILLIIFIKKKCMKRKIL